MPNVLAIFPGKRHPLGGCEIYRTSMPFFYLEKKYQDWKTSWAFYEDLWIEAYQTGPVFWKNLALNFDLFVFPRMYFKNEQAFSVFTGLVDSLHQLGKKVVYEVDDDMSNHYRNVVSGDAIGCMRLCDAVTVTTPMLKESMSHFTEKPIYVLPNMIAPETWLEPSTGTFLYEDKVVIGLSGSSTHYEDWKVLETVLPKILQDPNVHLLLMGFHPDYLADLPNTSYVPGVSYDQYAQVIQCCDIILCSINNDPFNLGKSPIKAIEGQSARRFLNGRPAGAACIASNHPVYQLAIQNDKTGLLVDPTPDDWLHAIDQLIYDTEKRQRLQVDGHSWVLKHHDISKTVSFWDHAYKAILRKPIPA